VDYMILHHPASLQNCIFNNRFIQAALTWACPRFSST